MPATQAPPQDAGGRTGRPLDPVSRLPSAHRRLGRDASRRAQGALDLRGRRRDRVVGGDRRRRRLRRVATGELHAVNLADGKPQWKYKASADRHRRVVAGGRGRHSSTSAISPASFTRSTSRPARRAWTFKTGSEIKSSPVVVGDNVLIGSYDAQPLRARRDRRQAGRGRCRPRATCTPRRRSSTASPTSPAATRSCAASASRTARKSSTLVVGRLHRRVAGDHRRPRLLRHLRERGARRRSEGEEDRLALQAPGAQLSRSTRRRRSSGDRVIRRRPRQDGARASIARPARRSGRS